jgi:uncharacterized membrane protein
MTHMMLRALAVEETGEEPPLFDALITPPASMGDRGFAIFLVVTLAVVCLINLCLMMVGLWWATLFLTGNLVFLLAAFVAVRRARDRSERIVVQGGQLRLERHWKGAPGCTDTLPLFGLRLVRIRDSAGHCRRLELHNRSQHLCFAADLTPEERESFAEALGRRLHQAGHAIAMPVRPY